MTFLLEAPSGKERKKRWNWLSLGTQLLYFTFLPSETFVHITVKESPRFVQLRTVKEAISIENLFIGKLRKDLIQTMERKEAVD